MTHHIQSFRLFIAMAAGIAAVPALAQVPSGRFRDLAPEQQAPILAIVEQYARISGSPQDPEKLYDSAKLSIRTTYDAISSALLATPLTAHDGQDLGSALSLIEVIEEIAGEVRDAPGDRQFRVYATLRPGAVETLRRSQQFRQGPNNTVYHKGFPLNFRLEGVPSIQISVSADERHADIDVDYRSSRFPAGLFNGHLTSANSDVRIGDNYPRHLRRWQGLSPWWANVLGIATQLGERLEELAPDVAGRERRAARGKIEAASADFFQVWLTERKAREAASYYSRESYACLEADARERGDDVSSGLVLAKTTLEMIQYASGNKDFTRLDQWMTPVEAWDARLLPVRHPASTAFSLFKVPNSVAEQDLACGVSQKTGGRRGKDKYGKYYASVKRFRTPQGEWSPAILMIWAKERKTWKIVRTRVAEAASPDFVSLIRRDAGTAPADIQEVPGDAAAVAAIGDWLESWFVRSDYKRAMAYVSDLAKACHAGASDKEGEDGYARVTAKMGRVKKLQDAIEAALPWTAGSRVVRHGGSGAFTIMEASEAMRREMACSVSTANTVSSGPVHYAVLFRFRAKAMNSGVLVTLWGREESGWKLQSWQLQAP